jgi:hypothetical protein
MPKTKKNIVAELIDAYAEARLAKTAAEKEETRLRKQILDQFEARGTNRLEGNVYEVTRSFSSREMLDGDAVRALLTADQIKAVTKTIPVTNLSPIKLNEVVGVRAA